MYKCVLSFAEIGQFQKIVGGLIELVDELAKEAETEKMKVSLAFEAAFIWLLQNSPHVLNKSMKPLHWGCTVLGKKN